VELGSHHGGQVGGVAMEKLTELQKLYSRGMVLLRARELKVISDYHGYPILLHI
jgi:hypothetical protein